MNLFWLLIVLLALGGAQSFVFSRFNFKSLKYTRTFSKRSVYEGETVEMVEQIVNRKLLPVPWLRVESRISPDLRFQTAQEEREISEDEQYHKSVFYLGPYSRVTRRHTIKCLHRGDYQLKTVEATAGDLVNMGRAALDYPARGAHPVLINSCIGVGFAVMNICITALVRSHVPAVQGGAKVSVTAVFALVAFLMMRSWAAQSQKKPLAFTPRVKRLYWYLGGVCALLGAVLELLNVGCFMYSLVPMIVWAGAYAAQPGEQRINHSFFVDAQKKLAERPDLIKIGITGSYGKTSTKFVLKTLLEEKYNVLATPSSFNTPMGVTRIVREQLRPEHQIFIGEMGARHVGDIKEMCELVHPSIGILTSIGPRAPRDVRLDRKRRQYQERTGRGAACGRYSLLCGRRRLAG